MHRWSMYYDDYMDASAFASLRMTPFPSPLLYISLRELFHHLPTENQ